jgi:indole-3-glycerol phosphate synthase
VTILSEIIESKREHIESLGSLEELQHQCDVFPRDDIRIPLWSDSLDVIAEIKRKSPSKGELAAIADPASLAKTYQDGGAAMISVLTDHHYFGALPDDLEKVRDVTTIPILRKDFIVDERQIFESYLMGADVILLIVAAFEDESRLHALYECAKSLSLGVLVETHSEAEREIAEHLGADLIGVNVRNLASFEEDSTIGDEVIGGITGAVAVWESSILTIEDAQRAQKAGADVVLIGQGLVQHENPGKFIEQIRGISAK